MFLINCFLAALFLVDVAFKIVSLGWRQYFNDGWNQLDFVSSLGAIIGLGVLLGTGSNYALIGNMVRVFRMGRILVNYSDTTRDLINSMLFSLPALRNVFLMLILGPLTQCPLYLLFSIFYLPSSISFFYFYFYFYFENDIIIFIFIEPIIISVYYCLSNIFTPLFDRSISSLLRGQTLHATLCSDLHVQCDRSKHVREDGLQRRLRPPRKLSVLWSCLLDHVEVYNR